MATHILGEEIPRRYVHNPPRNMFPPTYFVERPMKFYGDPYQGLRRPRPRPTTGVSAEVEEQLRALGYVQ